MWDIAGIANRLKIVAKAPEPPPPPPESKPQTQNLSARTADLRQTEMLLRSRVENLFDYQSVSPNVCAPTPAANPSASQILQIARENAPLLVLPENDSPLERIGEQNFLPNVSQSNLPADPQTYIENSRLREDVSFDPNPFSFNSGNDRQFGDNTNAAATDDFTASTVGSVTNERYFLDLDNGMRGKLGSENAPVSYQFEPAKNGAPPKLTYHLFYAYNDAPKAGPIDFNHEGDWERVTYELDPTMFKPVRAALSAHEGGSTYDFQSLERDAATGRPLVYVANGSHANYASAGNHSIEVKGVPVTFDQTSERDDAVIFDSSRNLTEVTLQPWYATSGGGLHWGEIGESVHSTGPQGSSENKGAVSE